MSEQEQRVTWATMTEEQRALLENVMCEYYPRMTQPQFQQFLVDNFGMYMSLKALRTRAKKLKLSSLGHDSPKIRDKNLQTSRKKPIRFDPFITGQYHQIDRYFSE